jgi:hypothetical protein
MNRKIFGSSLALALLMVAANGLWAQNQPTPILVSPQSQSTQGRFRSNADDFIRSDYYTNLKFNTFYAHTSFASASRASSLGFATKVGGLYLAAYYGGTFWANKTRFSYTEGDIFFNGDWRTVPTYGGFYGDPIPTNGTGFGTANPDNRFAILLGLANMGFRLSYASTHEDFDESDFVHDGTFYSNYVIAYGVIAPQLEWAMAKDLTEKNGLRPKVGLTLNFNRNYQREQTYNPADGKTNDEWISYSRNYVEPHLVLNPNGFHVYNKDGFRLTVDLDYELRFRMYSNEYSYVNTEGNVRIETIKGLFAGGPTGGLTENSYMDNLFTPSLAGQWSNEKIGLKFKLSLPLGITSTGTTTMRLDSDYRLAMAADSKATALRFLPNLCLAAQWKALPDKLHLNIGGRLDLSNITRTSTESSAYDANGDKVEHSDSKRVARNFDNTRNQLTLGVSFLPIENLTFEANCGIGANNAAQVFAADGLVSFGSILAGLKF